MPFYIVEHGEVSVGQVSAVMSVEPSEPDIFGVNYINAFLDESDILFTVANAANINMIKASHRALGLPVLEESIHPLWIGSLPTT